MKTKQARVSAIIAAYQSHFPGPFTMDALTEWTLAHDLWPVPKRGCSDEEAAAWAAKLAKAKGGQS